jgi:hypothetical protein
MKFDGGSGRPLLFKRVVSWFLDSPREQERCAPMRGALSTSPRGNKGFVARPCAVLCQPRRETNRGFVCAPMRGALSISPGDNRGFVARPCAGVHESFKDVARNVRQVPIIPGEATRFPTLRPCKTRVFKTLTAPLSRIQPSEDILEACESREVGY